MIYKKFYHDVKVVLANEKIIFPLLDVICILNAPISFQLFIYRFFANANLHMNICKYLFVLLHFGPCEIFSGMYVINKRTGN